MPTTTITIANLALGHLGISKDISSFGERSSEAKACNRFYERARDAAQSRYPWKVGLRRVTLDLLPDNDWEDEFLYAYRLPDDCKWFRWLYIGQKSTDPAPPHRLVSDDDGQVIITDVADAVAEYSLLVEDPALWSTEQIDATSYKLAALMARTFDEDNASATRKEMEQLYEIELSRAAAKDLNNEQPPDQPKSEFETCRN